MDKRSVLGQEGEAIVAKKLEKEGFTIIAQNYTRRFGEIDVIALKDDLLVFVEVKMRKTAYFDLAYLITSSKQKRIVKTAKEYILRHNYDTKNCRFDVALIKGTKYNYELTYIPNAFGDTYV